MEWWRPRGLAATDLPLASPPGLYATPRRGGLGQPPSRSLAKCFLHPPPITTQPHSPAWPAGSTLLRLATKSFWRRRAYLRRFSKLVGSRRNGSLVVILVGRAVCVASGGGGGMKGSE
jgi:hypothetical protein